MITTEVASIPYSGLLLLSFLCVLRFTGTGLKVAKFDAVNNEFPDEFAITGYPTLFFVPSGDKKHPVKFVGERTLHNVIEFIEKHRSGKSQYEDNDDGENDGKDDTDKSIEDNTKDEL